MWIEYSIPAEFDSQKRIINSLRTLIENIEEQGLIRGFAFDHYFGRTDVQDDLRVRFDYPTNEENSDVRNALRDKVREFVPDYSPNGIAWKSNEEVLRAYEFGSRCAFLYWKMAAEGKFPENYLSNFVTTQNGQYAFRVVPFNFQFHFNHGVMNSLSVPKQPNEQWIHLLGLIESTRSHNPEELCQWIKKQPQMFYKFFEQTGT